MNLSALPFVNASLNAATALWLVLGFIFVKRKNLMAHKVFMLSACETSILFLISYLYYHYHHGVTRFLGQGTIRTVYFAILVSHTILAIVIVPLVLKTLYHALCDDIEKHKKLARITLPLWLYVSVTGVVVYWMLYRTSY